MKVTLNIGFIDKRDFVNRIIRKDDTIDHNFHFFRIKAILIQYLIKYVYVHHQNFYSYQISLWISRKKNDRFLETLSKDTDYHASTRHFKVRKYIEYA